MVACSPIPALAASDSSVATPTRPSLAADTWPCWPYEPCPTVYFVPTGNGSGHLRTTSSPGGPPDGLIDCHLVNGVRTADSICQHTYTQPGYNETFTIFWEEVPDIGSKACEGGCADKIVNAWVEITTAENRTYSDAMFELQPYTVSVSWTGTGTGAITSSPAGIACPGTCLAGFLFGRSVTLTATPDSGAYFAGWTGGCAGQDATCTFDVPASTTTTNAVFAFGTPPPTAGPTAKPTTPRPSTEPGHSLTSTPGVSSAPVVSSVPAPSNPTDTSPTSIVPAATTTGTGPAAGSFAPIDPGNTSAGSDLTPIALAILAAGVLIAGVLGVIGFALLRRRGPA